jgi:hypothetical protein
MAVRKRKAPARGKARANASRKKLEAEMTYLDGRLDALIAAARRAEANVRAGTMQQLRALSRKQGEAQKALARLGRQSTAASGPMIVALQKAWHDIEIGVRQATRRFRETA